MSMVNIIIIIDETDDIGMIVSDVFVFSSPDNP